MLKDFIDLAKDLLIIIIVVLIIRTFFIMPFQISGQSMYDSYYDREFIIVDRFSYLDIPYIKKWNIKRWDVIVFRPHVSEDKEFFIKRVLWLPWDQIKIKDGNVFLFDKDKNEFIQLDEKYLDEENYWATFLWSWDKEPYIYNVPDDSYFVMWDNRNHSTDSRHCFSSCIIEGSTNYIKKDAIIWRLFIDLWYFNFREFSFIHPKLWIDTKPKWFSSNSNFKYNY